MGEGADALWYSRSSVPTPFGVAAQLGWLQNEFDSDGIAVLSVQSSADAEVRRAHTTHDLPNLFRQGGSVPAIWSRARGVDTRLIGLTWTDEFQVLITRHDSGIGRARDLRGRKLGLPLHSDNYSDMARATALRAYLSVLELNGISYRDVEFVDVLANPTGPYPVQHSDALIAPPEGHRNTHTYTADVAALLRGDVDAIYLKGVRGVEVVRRLGERAVIAVDISGNPDTRNWANNATPRPITVSAKLAQTRPDLVARFLRRVVDVGRWAEQHPQETLALISRETGSRLEWVSYAYGDDLHRHLFTNLDPQTLAALEEFKNFLFQWGFIENNFAIDDWVDTTAMRSIDANLLFSQHLRVG